MPCSGPDAGRHHNIPDSEDHSWSCRSVPRAGLLNASLASSTWEEFRVQRAVLDVTSNAGKL